MDRTTRWKVIRITAFWVVVGYLYIHREQIFADFRHRMSREKWETEAPKGALINGRKNGEWVTYFTNGHVAAVEHYRNDTLHGPQIFYTPEGFYKARAKYHRGIRVDSFHQYSSNGRVNIVEYRDPKGMLQGDFRIHDTNGQLIQKGQYKDGEFNGEFKTFYRTGELKAISHYLMGERTGTWLEFSVEGDTVKVERY